MRHLSLVTVAWEFLAVPLITSIFSHFGRVRKTRETAPVRLDLFLEYTFYWDFLTTPYHTLTPQIPRKPGRVSDWIVLECPRFFFNVSTVAMVLLTIPCIVIQGPFGPNVTVVSMGILSFWTQDLGLVNNSNR